MRTPAIDNIAPVQKATSALGKRNSYTNVCSNVDPLPRKTLMTCVGESVELPINKEHRILKTDKTKSPIRIEYR